MTDNYKDENVLRGRLDTEVKIKQPKQLSIKKNNLLINKSFFQDI